MVLALWLFVLKIRNDGIPCFRSKRRVGKSEEDTLSVTGRSDVDSMEMGVSGILCVDCNVDLTRKIDSLKYKDAIKLRHDSTIHPDTLVKDVYRGFHITIDVIFNADLPPDFGNDLSARMCELAKMHELRVVHDHVEIFDGTTSPPGFAAVALLGQSHMSAHCYLDQKKIAFDVFASGPDPDCTRKVARDMLFYLRQSLGSDAKYQINHLPRFPDNKGNDSFASQTE